jgi:hypothetical protein
MVESGASETSPLRVSDRTGTEAHRLHDQAGMKRHNLSTVGTVLLLLSTGAWTPQPSVQASAPAPIATAEPADRDVVIPAGTILSVELRSSVGSDSSRIEDAVSGTLRRAVTVKGITAIPAGTAVRGHVTDVARSARVKGRARVAFRFNQLDLPGAGNLVAIRTASIARTAPATKKADAAKIGGGAAGGALIGAIVGGGDGAAKGAAIGGAAGTGVVLGTRGKEVRVGAGTPVSVRLLQPVTIRVRS